MKTLISRLSLVLPICLFLISSSGVAQQTINTYFWQSSPTCPTPVLANCYVLGYVDNFNSSTDSVDVSINWGDGTSDYSTDSLIESGTTDSFSLSLSHTYSSAGTFFIQVISTMPNGLADTTNDSITVHTNCILIDGTIYDDANSNCTLDGGESKLAGQLVSASSSGGAVLAQAYTDTAGHYQFSIGSGQTGVVVQSPNSSGNYYSTTCPSGGSYTISTSISQTLDFGKECLSSTFDQRAHHSFSGVGAPGDSGVVTVVGSIRGCAGLNQTDTVILELSPLVSYVAPRTGPAPDLIVGNTLYWYYTSSTSTSTSFSASVWIFTLTTTAVFDTACFRVYTTLLSGDVNTYNNSDNWCLIVGGPYDPNDKAVTPAGYGAAGYISNDVERLTYRVRFQNTGTAEAKNIYILDTISDKLNIESMRIEATSHNMVPYFNDDRQIRFDFPKIYLIDSNTNEPESHGFVIYSIELADSFAPGTQIENTAYIFFDYNAPIVTNTVLNTIEDPTTSDSLNLSFDKRNVTCLDNDNGYIQAQVTGGIPPFAYTWSNGETTNRIEKLAPGTYGLTVMDSMNDTVSGSEIVAENRTLEGPLVDSIVGTVNAQAFKTYFYSIDPTIGHSYEWDAIGGEVTGSAANEASILWYAGPTGTILLDQYDENGCLGQGNQEVPILFVGIGDDPSAAIKVYPNPAKNLLTILRPEAKQSTARLYDVGGRLVFERSLNAIEEAINVSSISSGAYNLRIEEGNSVVTFPVMIRH